LPYHWGFRGLSRGDSANDLFGIALDPNVHIQEDKAATCDVRPGRRPRGAALRRLVAEHALAAPERGRRTEEGQPGVRPPDMAGEDRGG
jgi:formate dehydrogenase major subunit